jgi:hypothetical protein
MTNLKKNKILIKLIALYIINIETIIMALISRGIIPRPLGRKAGGAGDLFPRIRKDFNEKSSIPRPLG